MSHPIHGKLILPHQLAKRVNGTPALIQVWLRNGLPTLGCQCKRMDPDIIFPWLNARGYLDSQGNARSWADVNN